MSIFSTILVFAVLPFGIIATVAAIVASGSGRARPARRYRPGRPYDFRPIWFLASPAQVNAGKAEGKAAPALESGAPVRPGPTGGASDRW